MINPSVLKIKMEHWLDSSAYIKANEAELSPAEITAVDFLMNAWRNHDFSPELATEAKENIDIMVQNDVLHGNSPKLKTQVQRFRGVASTLYTSDAETYEQFRTELAQRMGINLKPANTPDSSSASSSRTTPPPPPPPSGLARLDIIDASIDIVTSRNVILRTATRIIPASVQHIRPNLEFATTVVGSKWKVTCKLVNTDGKEVATSVTDCITTFHKGTLNLNNFSFSTLRPGDYRLWVYINGEKCMDKAVTVTPDDHDSEMAYAIKINGIASTDENGNQVSPHILTTAQFITPTIDIYSKAIANQHIKLQISIFSPSGTLKRNELSPEGHTYIQTVDFRGATTIALHPWGNNQGQLFTEAGMWRIELRLPDGRIVMKRFEVKRPLSTTSPIEISNVDFYLPKSRNHTEVANDNNYAEAPQKLTSHVSPRIEFSLNNALEVAEISYVIYKHTDIGMRKIFHSVPHNYNIRGRRSLLLAQTEMICEQFVPGAYSIRFIVNGVSGTYHEFTVLEKAHIPWGKVGAVAFIIAMFAIGLLM